MADPITTYRDWEFCEQMLPLVSRSFALIIPQCPPPIDRALCVAYLLCRIADTIEDEPAFDRSQRGRLYDDLLMAVAQPNDEWYATAFRRAWPLRPKGDYWRLIEGTEHVLHAFASLLAEYREPILVCVRDMIVGMRESRSYGRRGGLAFYCRDLNDLDRYCHHVAGTVGIMSTALFEIRLCQNGFQSTVTWRENGRRLGLGLQMTNIIKDSRADAARGVSFIPADYIDAARRGELIAHALGHLDAGLEYVLAVPVNETGIRSFLLGSLFPAIATLDVVAHEQDKISRVQMTEILEFIRDHVGDNAALAEWYERQRKLI